LKKNIFGSWFTENSKCHLVNQILFIGFKSVFPASEHTFFLSALFFFVSSFTELNLNS